MNKIPTSNPALMAHLSKTQHPVTLPIIGKTVNITSYNHNDSKMVLELLEDFRRKKIDAYKRLFSAMEQLIDRNIVQHEGEDKIYAKNLQLADFSTLMDKLRVITKGEAAPLRCSCRNVKKDEGGVFECFGVNGKPHIEAIKFNFEDCIIKNEENKDIKEVILKLSNTKNCIFGVKPYTFGTMIDNANMFSEKIKIEAITPFYASFIDTITIKEGEDIDVFENQSTDAKISFLGALNDMQLSPLVNYVTNVPKLFWKKEWKCPICDTVNTAILSEPHHFFL